MIAIMIKKCVFSLDIISLRQLVVGYTSMVQVASIWSIACILFFRPQNPQPRFRNRKRM
jgi:hypothetical protein